jgi:hypothetical protein
MLLLQTVKGLSTNFDVFKQTKQTELLFLASLCPFIQNIWLSLSSLFTVLQR